MCYDTLCLSGGGVAGLDIIGSLKYLVDNNIIKLNDIKTFIGTSVGTLINIVLIIGYKINTIIKILYKLDFSKISVDFDIDNFFDNYGIDNGSKIISMIQTLLFNKLGVYDITFKELYKRTNKILKILVVNYSKKREEVLSYENNPDMSIILALRMSMSIPLIFYPVKYKNNFYIDGGMLNNFPFNHCNTKKTIGICIDSTINENPDSILDYIKGLFTILQKAVTFNHFNNENIIVIETDAEIGQFGINKELKYKYIKNGYKKTKKRTKNDVNFFVTKFINDIFDDAINSYKSKIYIDI